MATKNNDDSLKKLGDKLRAWEAQEALKAKKKIPVQTVPNESIAQMVAEGNAIIEKENEVNIKKMSPAVLSNNPYVKARIIVLKQLTGWKLKEINRMEMENDKDNRLYAEFVENVAKEGDKLSP
jgi:hypothetical protein